MRFKNYVSPWPNFVLSTLLSGPFGLLAAVWVLCAGAGAQDFRINTLTSNNAVVVDAGPLVGDDRGGLAVSATHAFISGDAATARFHRDTLGSGVSLGLVRDGLVANLASSTVYLLGNGAAPLPHGGGTFNSLIELNGATGVPNGNRITLSAAIPLTGSSSSVGIFSGWDRIVVHNGTRAYRVSLPSGTVTDLGAMVTPTRATTENWAYWGVAENVGTDTYLVYVRNNTTVARTLVPSGATTTVATFVNLGDMASITVSPSQNRWYFHNEGGSQFGNIGESLGYADATFLAASAAPTMLTQPASISVLAGEPANFSYTAVGTAPLTYQWYKNTGTGPVAISGATDPVYSIAATTVADAAAYSVIIANAAGSVTSSPAALTVTAVSGGIFKIVSLTANNPVVVNASPVVGDDRGGIAVSGTHAFLSGDTATGRFPRDTLTGGSSLGVIHDSLVANLATSTVYLLGNGSTPLGNGGGTLTTLLELNGTTGITNGNCITLSAAIPLTGSGSSVGIFSGWDRIVLHNGTRAYRISLPTGTVTDLGAMATPTRNAAESWAYWGVAENIGTDTYIVYISSSTTVSRTLVPNGPTTTVATFENIPDMASFTVSVTQNRWYFHNEIISQFGNFDESLGYADATFLYQFSPPAITVPPQSLTVTPGSNATFTVTATGTPAPTYQWLKNGLVLAGATQPTLTLPAVTLADVGAYTVIVTNSRGAVTSAPPATLALAVNDPPTFTLAATHTANEDAGPQIIANHVTNILPGPADEAAQLVTFTVTNNNNALFSTQPAISPTGTLTYTPATNAFGTATVTVIVQDNGGTANGGVDTSAPQTFTLTVNAVNDAPTIAFATNNVVAPVNGGARTQAGFITTFTPGPADEAAQTVLGYTVTHDNAALFTVAPAINAAGTLTFTPAANAVGTATVTVRAQDSGGTANGGVDLSAPQAFTVTVVGVNDAPSFSLNVSSGVGGAGVTTNLVGWGQFVVLPAITTGRVTNIYAATTHNFAALDNGTFVGWGDNGDLQSVLPAAATNLVAVNGGTAHSVGLRADGTLVAWGNNYYGQTTVPGGLTGVVAVAAGGIHSLALKNDGTVVAWGAGGAGQTEVPHYGQSVVPAGLSGVAAIAAHGDLSLALKIDGTVVAWGASSFGQTNVPVGLATVVAVASGGYHALALKSDGTVVAWGRDGNGESTVPSGLTGVIAIGASEYLSVALRANGTVVAWGANFSGQTSIPAGLSDVVAISVGSGYTLALKADGSIVAWGPNNKCATVIPGSYTNLLSIAVGPHNTVAVLADGTVSVLAYNHGAQRPVPTGLNSVTAVTVGYYHTVALKADGTLVAWGDSSDGRTTVPAQAVGVSRVAAGSYHTLALTSGGSVVAWGKNSSGETVVPAGLSGVSNVAAGHQYSLALKADGTVVAWGDNTFGQLNVPVGLSGVTAIAAGSYHVLALRNDGTVVAWGRNENGSTSIPAGLTGVVAVAAGTDFSVVLKSDGTVLAWGSNFRGETVLPGGLVGVRAIVAGGEHVVALTSVGVPTVVQASEDGGPQSFANIVTNLSPGPADEAGQTVSFLVSHDNAALFSVVPALAANGTLTFTPAAHAFGTATVTVRAQDNGGTALGGVDTSAPQTFTLTVNAVNDVPSFALAQSSLTLAEDSGPQTIATLATSISAGPANESSQTVAFVVTSDNAGLFSAGPTVAANGTLTFTPAANAVGSATVTVRAQDSGGTANGGVDTSAAQTFTVTVTGVNDAPSFALSASSLTVARDASAQTLAAFATNILVGPADEAAQLVTFTVTNSNNALFSSQPALAANGTLTYTPAAGVTGTATVTVRVQDNGGTANGGVDTSAAQTFTIVISPANQPPTVTFATNTLVRLEDAGAQSLASFAAFSPGPAHESTQTVSIVSVTAATPSLFSAQPALAANGTLTFTPATNANGLTLVTVVAQDNGGTAGGGVDRSTNTFTFTVTAVNDAPGFALPAGIVANRALWAWGLNSNGQMGDGTTDGKTSPVQIGTATNWQSVAAGAGHTVAVKSGGTLWAWGLNSNGQMGDGTTGGKTSPVQIGTATNWQSAAVGDNHTVALAGTASAGPYTLTVVEDAGAQTVAAFATSILAGHADESGQLVTFTVTNNNSALFSVQPALSTNGTLTFTPATNAFGTATVTVIAQDNGGTANGGVDTSAPQTFTITVTPGTNPPAITQQPSGLTLVLGGAGMMQVGAEGGSPLVYQWFRNGVAVDGGTNSSLAFSNVQVAQAGAYSVVITNAFGSVTSSVVTLNVLSPPTIAVPPVSQSAFEGGTVNHTVTVTGSPTLTYQWRFNGVSVPGATSSTLTLANVQSVSAGGYSVVVSNPYGSVTSAVANVSVLLTNGFFAATRVGGTGADEARPVVVDASGNVYWAGWFNGNFTLGASNLTSQSGSDDGFIVKQDVAGNVVWIKTLVSSGSGIDRILGLSLTTGGDLLVAGQFFNGSATLAGTALSSGTANGVFVVAKLSTTDGSVVWARNPSTSTGNNYANAVAADAAGNVYVAGTFNSTSMTVNGTTFNVSTTTPSQTTREGFLIKYDGDGNFQWFRQPGAGGAWGGVAADTNGGVYVVGEFFNNDGSEFGGATNIASLDTTGSPALENFIMAKYDSAGTFQWTVHSASAGGFNSANGVAIHPSGDVIMAGGFVGPTTFAGQTWNTLADSKDAFVARLSPAGQVRWSSRLGGSGSDGSGGARNLAVDAQGNLVLAGNFSSTMTINDITVTSAGARDVVVWRLLGESGALYGMVRAGSTADDYGQGAAVAPNGEIYLTGTIGAAATFGSVTLDFTGGTSDAFLARMDPGVTGVPFLITQSTNQTVLAGANATFTVGATGGALTYQWRFNGTNLAGATNASLTLASLTTAQAGNYDALLANDFGSVTSSVAVLTIVSAPTISVQPVGVTASVGGSRTMSVTATGTAPLSYQWARNGTPLAGQTSATLTLTNLQIADAGLYTVTVTNAYGSAVSVPARLTVGSSLNDDLVAWYPLDGDLLDYSGNARHGTATNFTPSYLTGVVGQALKFAGIVDNRVDVPVWVPGTNSFTFSGWVKYDSTNEFAFWPFDPVLLLFNSGSGDWSHGFAVSLNIRTNGVVPAFSVVSAQGSSVTLRGTNNAAAGVWHHLVGVMDRAAGQIRIYWNGTLVGSTSVAGFGAINSTWSHLGGFHNGTSHNAAHAARQDDVRIYSRVLGEAEILSLASALHITAQPVSQTVFTGQSATLTVGALGTTPLAYQWRKAGVNLPSGTNAQLTLAPVTSDDAGNYDVVVTDSTGSVTSSVATVTVNLPNVAPTFAFSAVTVTALEDAGLQSVAGFVTNIVAGPTNEAAQTVTLSVTAANTALFSAQPAIAANGTLTFTPVANANGSTLVTVVAQDNGGTAGGGVDRSTNTFTLTVTAVNDVPGFALNGAQYFAGGPGVQTNVTGWGNKVVFPLAGLNATFTNLSAGSSHNLALTSDGTVVAWGLNSFQQATVPAGIGPALAVAAGQDFSAVLKTNGTVVAWGHGTVTNVPVGLSGVVALAAGSHHALALKSDGTVLAWGENAGGAATVPVGLNGVVAIAAGSSYSHSLALKSDGTVVGWGSGAAATVPGGLSGVVGIAAGSGHALALKSDGTVVAWGSDSHGQAAVPAGLTGVTAISAGLTQSLARKSDGTVVLWGQTNPRQFSANFFPVGSSELPPGLSSVTGISAGGQHALALKSDGSIVAWGWNHYGQTAAPGTLTDVVAVAAGEKFSLGLKANGTVVAWDDNEQGDNFRTTVPAGLTNVTAVAVGLDHFMALKSDGTVVGWDMWAPFETQGPFRDAARIPTGLSNVVAIAANENVSFAVRRDGTLAAWGGSYTAATVPADLTNAVAVTAGRYHAVAVRSDSTVVVWGQDNFGALSVPSALNGVTGVAAGNYHTLALRSDGTVVAWGDNTYGQVTVPAGLSGVTAVAAGGNRSLAVKSDGSMVAWGDNAYGLSTVPAGLVGVRAVAAGGTHSIALFAPGTPANAIAVAEEAGPQALSNFATAILAGPADEAGQVVSFTVTNDNAVLFSVAPAIGTNGTLTFTPAGNAAGTATLTVIAQDNGGTANGGVDTSAAQTFTITVNAVNDAPSFALAGTNLTVFASDGAVARSAWATNISAGAANEAGQSVSFVVTNSDNAKFTVQPALAANGSLTFTPAANATGVVTVGVRAVDDGGTANGGVDTSAVQTFTISLAATKVVLPTAFAAGVGDSISVPVSLIGAGVENGVAFTVTYPAAQLTYTGASAGGSSAGATVLANASTAGQAGALVFRALGTTWSAGSNEVVLLHFTVAAGAGGASVPLAFADGVVARQVSDVGAVEITPVLYTDGAVQVAAPGVLEGDVSPRPMGSGTVTVTDAIQISRFAAGLDTVTNFGVGGEFQRADVAPRASLGDGRLTVADAIQAQRYAAGLDPATTAGGPTGFGGAVAAAASAKLSTGARVVRVVGGNLVVGRANSVAVQIDAQGDEAGLSLSLAFDPAALTFVSATAGPGAGGGALVVNAARATSGRVGLVLMLPAGSSLTAGARDVVTLTFNVTGSGATNIQVAGDLPVAREVADVNANVLGASFVGASFNIVLPAGLQAAGVERAADGSLRLVIRNADGSPVTAGQAAQYAVHVTSNLGGVWTLLPNALVLEHGALKIIDPAASGAGLRVYKLVETR